MAPRYYNEEGWADNIAQFVGKNASGITEPAFENVGNGLYAYGFTDGEAMVIQHHVDHDVKVDGLSHMHVHFAPSTAPSIGDVMTWTLDYTIARRSDRTSGHVIHDPITAATTQIVLTYTADGTEVAGEHLVVEDATGFTTPETDSFIITKVTYTSADVAKCYGLTMDMHYEVDRNATPNKAYPFTV